MKLFSWYHNLSHTRMVTVWSVLCLGPLFLGWTSLIVLSHQTTESAIMWTQQLFGWMLLITYGFLWSWAIGVSRQPRLTLFRGIAWTITFLVILFSLELVAVLKMVHWGLVFEQISDEPQNYLWAYQPDKELEFRRRPNDHWKGYLSSDIEYRWLMPRSRNQPFVFTYDKWGYRNTVDLKQADVALIGDSYVEGWYVSDTETTAQRLQSRLSRPVINLGVAGYGTNQELLVLQKDAIRFNPRVIIFFFFEGNDFYDDNRFENSLLSRRLNLMVKNPNPLGLAWTQGWQQRSFIYNLFLKLRRLAHPVLPNTPPYFGYFAKPGQDKNTVYFTDYAAVPWNNWLASRWGKAQDSLTQAAAFSHDKGIHVLFTFIPIKFRVYQPFVSFPADSPCRSWSTWPIDALFNDFCQTSGVPCLDLTKPFQENLRNGGMPYSPVDSHWSPEGHDLVAQLLEKELHQRGWLSMKPLVYQAPASDTTRN